MRKIKCVSLILVLAICVACLPGCGKKGLCLKVRGFYSGYGSAGQALGGGINQFEIKSIEENDVVYEYEDHSLSKESREESGKTSFFRVDSRTSEGIVVIYRGESILLPYDSEVELDSKLADLTGIRYTYYLTLTKN